MRIVALLAALVLLYPSGAIAQTTTSEGVQAIARGDYAAAARILRPLAEGTSKPDPVAQFFMAMLYDSGLGVPHDRFRACGLYASASKQPNPLMDQASVLADNLRPPIASLPIDFCSADVWQPGPSASFTLAPSHSIAIDSESATVRFNGIEKQTKMQMGGAGFRFLPIRYLPLDVTRPVAGRRHFIEFLLWMPNKADAGASWTLGWMLNEIVGAEVVSVAGDPRVLIEAAPQPPSIDPDSVVRVRVDANGEAEWVILRGSNPRSAVIPLKTTR